MNALPKGAWKAFLDIVVLVAVQSGDVQKVEEVDLETANLIWGRHIDTLFRAELIERIEPVREDEGFKISKTGLQELKQWCAQDETRARTYADVIRRLDAVFEEPPEKSE